MEKNLKSWRKLASKLGSRSSASEPDLTMAIHKDPDTRELAIYVPGEKIKPTTFDIIRPSAPLPILPEEPVFNAKDILADSHITDLELGVERMMVGEIKTQTIDKLESPPPTYESLSERLSSVTKHDNDCCYSFPCKPESLTDVTICFVGELSVRVSMKNFNKGMLHTIANEIGKSLDMQNSLASIILIGYHTAVSNLDRDFSSPDGAKHNYSTRFNCTNITRIDPTIIDDFLLMKQRSISATYRVQDLYIWDSTTYERGFVSVDFRVKCTLRSASSKRTFDDSYAYFLSMLDIQTNARYLEKGGLRFCCPGAPPEEAKELIIRYLINFSITNIYNVVAIKLWEEYRNDGLAVFEVIPGTSRCKLELSTNFREKNFPTSTTKRKK